MNYLSLISNGASFHFATLYFLFGVTCTLLVLLIVLWIATKVMERKIKKMEDAHD